MRQINDFILLMIVVMLFGCSKSESPNNLPVASNDISEYLPIKIGNSWTYYNSTIPINSEISIQNASSSIISVLYTKLLVGGQPNAFMLRIDSETGEKQNFTFYMDRKTLYNYIGESNSLVLASSYLPWLSGSVTGVRVGLNESKKFKIDDYSGAKNNYSIEQFPDNTIASASMISPDSILVSGFQKGNTTLVLRKVKGAESDTMTVIVQVSQSSQVIFPSPMSWLPVWQMTTSTGGENIYSWDTTYSFRLYSDSSQLVDRIRYCIDNRFIGKENMFVFGGQISCEKYEMKVTIYEHINLGGDIVFDGLSGDFTATIWMAKEIGFVKGKTYGSMNSFLVLVNGAIDSSGVLYGAFVSPRVSYAVISEPPSYIQVFNIKTDILQQAQTASAFLLKAKNF